MWDKHVTILTTKGIPNHFEQYKAPLKYNYVRGWYHYDYKSGEISADHQKRRLEEELARQHAEPQSSQGSTARWNTPLKRLINVTLGKDPLHLLAGGLVNGARCRDKWDYHYVEDREQ